MKSRKNLLIILSIAVAVVIGIWVIQILRGDMPYTDQLTIGFVAMFEATLFYEMFYQITHLGSRGFLFPFVITVTVLFLLFKKWLEALFFSIGTALTHVFNKVIKQLVDRERPSILVEANAEGYSFPSGHAMVPIVCYGILAYFLTKNLSSTQLKITIQIGFALLIFFIGISRYVIHVHYLTDVFAGFFIGYLILIGLIYLYEFLRVKQSPSKD